MAKATNKISRKFQTRKDQANEIAEQIEKLEENIRRLKIEFDIYFNGGMKTPPHKARARIEANLTQVNGNRDLSYANRYRLNSIMSRYNSYRQLWKRRLKPLGDDIY